MSSDTRSGLDQLFAPDSVAIVGASADSSYTAQLIRNLINQDEPRVYPVNPNRDRVFDLTCFDSLDDVPEVVDLAVISVPRDYVVDVIEEAGALGVPAALIIAAGFSEADERGRCLTSELEDVINRYNINVAGPQSVGLVNAVEGVALTSLIETVPSPGSLGIISQSGGFAFTALERGVEMNLNPAYAIATGNELDLTLVDYLDYMIDDPNVSAIVTYIEGVDDPRRFMNVAESAVRRGVPVITIKIGQSELTELTTKSHTGSLTGPDAGWTAAFTQTGVQQVADLPELLNRAAVHTAFDTPASNRVCIVTSSGGYMNMLADMATDRGLELPDLNADTERELLDFDILAFDELHNPVDVRGYGMEVLPDIADVVFADDSFDSYVFVNESKAIGEQAERIADNFLAAARRASDPVVILWAGCRKPEQPKHSDYPLPYERVQQEVPVFQDAVPCMNALASLVTFDTDRKRLQNRPSRNELSTEQSVADIGLPNDRILTWNEAATLLKEHDIHPHETRLTKTPSQAVEAAVNFGFPVVLKVDSTDIPHRGDANAVITGITSPEEVRRGFNTIVENVQTQLPDADINGVLVQPEVNEGIEVLVGTAQDRMFGPLLTVGLGGTLVEVFEERTTRIPPISRQDAEDAMAEIKLNDVLATSTDVTETGIEELTTLMTTVSQLVTTIDGIAELDFNPVVVHDRGISIVDILIRTE